MRALLPCFVLLVIFSGCGGKVVLDGGGGAGGLPSTITSGGAGGATTTTTTTTTTTAASTTAATTTTTVTSSVSTSSGAGGSGPCPLLAPNNGDPCDSPGLVCKVPVCCVGTATCVGAVWQVTAIPCGLPCLSCPGTLGCAIGAVCVDNPIGGGPVMSMPHFNCAPDPCPANQLACGCAASLCVAGLCGQASGSLVTCENVVP